MSVVRRVDMGKPALLEFRGPDAVRYLNGQITQDVRRVAGGKISLPSCVTDAKGKLQFRVTITEAAEAVLWVSYHPDTPDALHARLTRYLIADDVEVADLTGTLSLQHFTGPMPDPPSGVIARASNRFGLAGTDWWLPDDRNAPTDIALLDGDELEHLRITNGIPAWGRELEEGMLPQEASLEASDLSYDKGCYIGQEVISRIKFAGKVNRRLVVLRSDSPFPPAPCPLCDAGGGNAGKITSVSPIPDAGAIALGFVKRGVEKVFSRAEEGSLLPVRFA